MIPRLQRIAELLTDPKTPRLPRLAVWLAVAYALWPIDALPDFAIPVVGFLDDLTLLWVSIRWLLRAAEQAGAGRPPVVEAGRAIQPGSPPAPPAAPVRPPE